MIIEKEVKNYCRRKGDYKHISSSNNSSSRFRTAIKASKTVQVSREFISYRSEILCACMKSVLKGLARRAD